ncbi:hypothetical protein HYW29_01520 [Candidatus Amesbacteria bacterium]|nr:hypothetical protein [Candidatus Amesbacteria bacterium]
MKHQIGQFLQKIKGIITTPLPPPTAKPPAESQNLGGGGQQAGGGKLMSDTTICPYCASKNFVRRGFRQKTLEKVQLLLCRNCHKTFTPQITKGKHYPLETIFDAISLYNLGYSLEESCRRVSHQNQPKTASFEAVTGDLARKETNPSSKANLPSLQKFVNRQVVDPRGLEPPRSDLTDPTPNPAGPQPNLLSLQPSTLSNWLTEFKDKMPYARMRDFAMQKYPPEDTVISATLAHRQLYRFRFHRAKCQAVMQEHFHHSFFRPLKEFLELVPSECPHHYFNQGERASETPLTFSKTAMIVRGKTNFATATAAFVLQAAKERKNRHEILQKFMLYNDSVTVATEVPVYLTRDDLEHLKSQLGFEIYHKENTTPLPKLITGHIDILQIRNGQIHILDFKPNAQKERPLEQLTLYACGLSRLTGLRLFEFKCAWFDEKDYFEFFPLHVLHKPKRAVRRKKVATMEGTYAVNKNYSKIERIRPL